MSNYEATGNQIAPLDEDIAALEAALKAAKRERKRRRVSAARKKAWAAKKIPPELKPIYDKLHRVLGRDAGRAELTRMMAEPS